MVCWLLKPQKIQLHMWRRAARTNLEPWDARLVQARRSHLGLAACRARHHELPSSTCMLAPRISGTWRLWLQEDGD